MTEGINQRFWDTPLKVSLHFDERNVLRGKTYGEISMFNHIVRCKGALCRREYALIRICHDRELYQVNYISMFVIMTYIYVLSITRESAIIFIKMFNFSRLNQPHECIIFVLSLTVLWFTTKCRCKRRHYYVICI